MNFLELAKSRYSVRKFKPEHLIKEDVDKILKAGHLAPTGCNNQPQRILVINSDESVEKLKRCTKCHFDAPSAFLICYNENETWIRPFDGAKSAPVDACIVTTHMMLEAASIGVGTTWVMYFEPDKIRKEFNIPENITPVALLVAGYPAEDAKPMNLHTEYRNQDEIVVYESF